MIEGNTALAIPLEDDAMTEPKLRRKIKKTIAVNNEEPLSGLRTPRHLPMKREHCIDGVRPCPYITCKHNLYLDVSYAGSIMPNFPDLEPHEMGNRPTCALDEAAREGMTLEEVGEVFNLTRERIRQVEMKAIEKFRSFFLKKFGSDWREMLYPDPTGDEDGLFLTLVESVPREEGS